MPRAADTPAAARRRPPPPKAAQSRLRNLLYWNPAITLTGPKLRDKSEVDAVK